MTASTEEGRLLDMSGFVSRWPVRIEDTVSANDREGGAISAATFERWMGDVVAAVTALPAVAAALTGDGASVSVGAPTCALIAAAQKARFFV